MENIDWAWLLFKFDGRINRAKFWMGLVIAWAIILVSVMMASFIGDTFGLLMAVVMYVVAVWMGIAISIKRWHDRGKSGWWIFIGFIPIVGPIWSFVETGFLEGTNGPNEYGPDPLVI